MTVKIEGRKKGRILVIKQTVAWWIRVIGLPFVSFGLYIFSMVFYSMYHYFVNDASVMEWLRGLLGMIITLLFAILFITPGVFFMFGRLGQYFECDLSSRKILFSKSFLPWRKETQANLDDYNLIKVEYVARKSKNRNGRASSNLYKTNYYFELNLYGKENTKLHLVSFMNNKEEKARESARKIGRLMMIAVDDNPWEEE